MNPFLSLSLLVGDLEGGGGYGGIGGGGEADGGFGEDVEVAADEGGVEGFGGVEYAENCLFVHVDVDHAGFVEVGFVHVQDADDVAVCIECCCHDVVWF